MIWKSLRVLNGTLFDNSCAREGNARLNTSTLKYWEIWEKTVKDYSHDDRFDTWYHYKSNPKDKLTRRRLSNQDDLIRIDQNIVAEYSLDTDRIQINVYAKWGINFNPFSLYWHLKENDITTRNNPFQVDPFQDLLDWPTMYSISEQIDLIETKLSNLQKPTPENMSAWRDKVASWKE
jgi:hypothetical protein